jgi:hypothetical protein
LDKPVVRIVVAGLSFGALKHLASEWLSRDIPVAMGGRSTRVLTHIHEIRVFTLLGGKVVNGALLDPNLVNIKPTMEQIEFEILEQDDLLKEAFQIVEAPILDIGIGVPSDLALGRQWVSFHPRDTVARIDAEGGWINHLEWSGGTLIVPVEPEPDSETYDRWFLSVCAARDRFEFRPI